MRERYYIEVDADQRVDGKEEVASALRAAGFTLETIEETGQECNGAIYTEEALREIWWLESGLEYCASLVVKGKPPHREWEELTDEQRTYFIAKMTEWAGDQRYDQFFLAEHDREGVFGGVAIECHQHAHPYPWERERADAKAK